MRTTLVITDGVTQIVLTPDTALDRQIVEGVCREHDVSAFSSSGPSVVPAQLHRGSFYECRGGWIRQGPADDSLIIRIEPSPLDEPSPAGVAKPEEEL